MRIWNILRRAVLTVFVVRETLNLWQWSDLYVFLDSRFSARPGRYDSRYTCYLRGPMAALSDRKVRRVTIKKGAQIGFTTMIANFIMYLVDMDPGPTLLVQSSNKMVRRYVRRELHPRFLGCERIIPYLPANRRTQFTTSEMYFTTMDFFCTGAGNAAQLASLPIKNAIGDEVDKWPLEDEKEASRKDLLEVRTITYEEIRKIVLGSTPTVPEMTISVEYQKGSQEEFHLPCPHCGHLQVPLFENLMADHKKNKNKDGTWKLDEVAKNTQLRCSSTGFITKGTSLVGRIRDELPAGQTIEKIEKALNSEPCGKLIQQSKKQWMMRRGVWLVTNTHAPEDHRSFNIRGELSNKPNWGALFKDFLQMKDKPGGLHHFYNSYLGREWERKANTITKKAIKRIQDECPIKYRLGRPDDAEALLPLAFRPVVITMHVDVQQAEFYWTMRAWMADGSRFLIANGRSVSYDELVRISNRTWTFTHEDGTPEEFQMFMGVIDSGYRAKRGSSVYSFVHEQGGRWIASKGGGYKGKEAPVVETLVQHRYQGEEVSIPFVHYNDDVMKEHLYRFVIKERREPKWYLPERLDPDYIEQITAEKLVEKRDSEGRVYHIWHADIDPHWGDCEKESEIFGFLLPVEVLAKIAEKLDGQLAAIRTMRAKS